MKTRLWDLERKTQVAAAKCREGEMGRGQMRTKSRKRIYRHHTTPSSKKRASKNARPGRVWNPRHLKVSNWKKYGKNPERIGKGTRGGGGADTKLPPKQRKQESHTYKHTQTHTQTPQTQSGKSHRESRVLRKPARRALTIGRHSCYCCSGWRDPLLQARTCGGAATIASQPPAFSLGVAAAVAAAAAAFPLIGKEAHPLIHHFAPFPSQEKRRRGREGADFTHALVGALYLGRRMPEGRPAEAPGFCRRLGTCSTVPPLSPAQKTQVESEGWKVSTPRFSGCCWSSASRSLERFPGMFAINA